MISIFACFSKNFSISVYLDFCILVLSFTVYKVGPVS